MDKRSKENIGLVMVWIGAILLAFGAIRSGANLDRGLAVVYAVLAVGWTIRAYRK